jgi:hypothetical protein
MSNANRTALLALALLTAFTCARAAHASDATYVDAKSGVSASLPEGFVGVADHRPDHDLLMKSNEIKATISIVAKSFGPSEVEAIVRQFEEANRERGGNTRASLTVYDDHRVATLTAATGRFIVLSFRPQGMALGSFVGQHASDAHVAVVDAVAQSIRVQKTARLVFDVPNGFADIPVENAKVMHDAATGRYLFMVDDEGDQSKTFAQQAHALVLTGLLGKGSFTILPETTRSPRTGIGHVDIRFTTKSGGLMAGVVSRVNMPGRPVWLIIMGPGNEPKTQQALVDEVITSMLRETVVAVR